MRSLSGVDLTAPLSRHNLHVTGRSDLDPVGNWSEEELYRAVKAADGDEADLVVVLDYGRSRLYLVAPTDLTYEPPSALGVGRPARLRVASPIPFDPETGTGDPAETVTVSPEFDILVPAFDWDDLEEDDMLPPMDYRKSGSPTGAGTGTPG